MVEKQIKARNIGTTDFVVRPIGSAPTADSLFFKGSDAYATLV